MFVLSFHRLWQGTTTRMITYTMQAYKRASEFVPTSLMCQPGYRVMESESAINANKAAALSLPFNFPRLLLSYLVVIIES